MDVILHITNKKKWQEELDTLSQMKDSDGNDVYPSLYWDENEKKGIFNFSSTQEESYGNQALTLVRINNPELIDTFKHAKKLGECINKKYVFDTKGNQKVYEKLRGDLEVKFYDSDAGQEITYNKPYEIGVFL